MAARDQKGRGLGMPLCGVESRFHKESAVQEMPQNAHSGSWWLTLRPV